MSSSETKKKVGLTVALALGLLGVAAVMRFGGDSETAQASADVSLGDKIEGTMSGPLVDQIGRNKGDIATLKRELDAAEKEIDVLQGFHKKPPPPQRVRRARPIFAEPGVTWHLLAACDGANKISVNNLGNVNLLRNAVSVLIEPEFGNLHDSAVQTKRCNYAVRALNKGREMSYQMADYDSHIIEYSSMDLIDDTWYGRPAALKRLWNSCGPGNGRSRAAKDVLYHACNNHGGIHIAGNICEFDYQNAGTRKVEVWVAVSTDGRRCEAETVPDERTPPIVRYEPGVTWKPFYSCGPNDRSTHGYNREIDLQRVVSVLMTPNFEKGNFLDLSVQTKRCNYAVRALNRGKELSYNIDAGIKTSPQPIIDANWYGSTNARRRLWNTCVKDGRANSIYHKIYHACNNVAGIHLKSRKLSAADPMYCDWDWRDPNRRGADVWVAYANDGSVCPGMARYNAGGIAKPVIPEPNVRWQLVADCNSANRFTLNRLGDVNLLRQAVSVLIQPDDPRYAHYTVQTKRCNYAVHNLNRGMEMSFEMADYDNHFIGLATRNLIDDTWYGRSGDLNRLTNSCNRGGAMAKANRILYHACGNHGGIHLIPQEPRCEFDFANGNGRGAKVFIAIDKSGRTCAEDLPRANEPYLAQPTPGVTWFPFYSCGPHERGNHVFSKKLDLRKVVMIAMVPNYDQANFVDVAVQSKRCNYAVKALNKGKEFSYILDANGNNPRPVNLATINANWYGSTNARRRLWNSCVKDGRVNPITTKLYHACGNVGGLHLNTRRLSAADPMFCDWDFQDANRRGADVWVAYSNDGSVC
jgi:hypothetical protein